MSGTFEGAVAIVCASRHPLSARGAVKGHIIANNKKPMAERELCAQQHRQRIGQLPQHPQLVVQPFAVVSLLSISLLSTRHLISLQSTRID